ncbi:GNAT family N-acetyltransferase [Planctomyces sp. SH-PL14]|uniref:GNAT family N-acetyltransferase n=1 Tax=Planctomyces sp. SH-PL14 TaxID=1632864 RepID=UPI00078DA780|nr:GNAT family N-acetyltransferase [Planctomyces sp. SH-PL14]AMV19701.1 hypothetical protein VT03_17525 [Planctomyces sp. SH-PL14]
MTVSTASPNLILRRPPPEEAVVSRLVVETDAIRALDQWRRLETRLTPAAARTSFRNDHGYGCSADWTELWLRHYGPLVPHRFLLHVTTEGFGPDRRETVTGIALVTQSRIRKGPLVLRQWHLGTAGEPGAHSVCVEYNRVLAESAFRTDFHEKIAEWFLDAGQDGIELDGLAPEEWESLRPFLPPMELRTQASKFFRLTRARAAGTDVLSQLGRSTRQGLRRKLRDYGPIETTWATEADTAHAIVDELIELHQARWNALGKPGSFSSPLFTAFQRDLLTHWAESQRVVAFRARHQGETVGCLVLLVEGRRILDYFSGFCAFDRKASPGMVTHALCMQEALERGFDDYDFLVGDKQHKDNLSTDEATLVWGTWLPDTWKIRTYSLLRQGRRKALDWFKRPAAEPAVPANKENEHEGQQPT